MAQNIFLAPRKLGLAAVFVLAVAGVAVEALEEKTNELNWIL